MARLAVVGRFLLALEYMARERGVNPTKFVNDLVFEEWDRTHHGMMFPDENGGVMPIECTPMRVNT